MNHHLKAVICKLDPQSRAALDTALSHAAAQQHADVTPEHLLMALLCQESTLMESLSLQAGLPVSQLFSALQTTLEQMDASSHTSTPVFTRNMVEWLINAWLLASTQWDLDRLSPAAMMAGLFDEQTLHSLSAGVQEALRCDAHKAHQLLQAVGARTGQPQQMSVSGSALAKYTRNLTEMARQGKLDPVLGRETEIRQMVDILLRRRQNNPILAGEPGVGKTALVEGLALRIVAGTVPQKLRSMEVLSLDLGLLQAGASVKGEFEKRLHLLLTEVACATYPVILFIDEAHTLIGAGGQAGQNDAANLLKPALARGELRTIAATTWAEYKKYVEKDAALARRFQVVKVDEPDTETAITMLRAMAPAMSQHHGISILESAIHAAVHLSSRYIAGRQLPDKAISLLDTACARVAVSQSHEPKDIEAINVQLRAINSECDALLRENSASARQAVLKQQAEILHTQLPTLQEEWRLQRDIVKQLLNCEDKTMLTHGRETLATCHQRYPMVFESVDATCVADVVSGWTGIPLGRMLEKEHHQLDVLFSRLEQRIVGQQHALEKITRQIRIHRAGMVDPQKPTGVYLLTGPSGTGKTETSLALAELLFGGEQSLVSINLSEYQEAHSVSGLKGSPPGYVGYGQGGVLTEAIRRTPYSVVLLDEIEKAHPDVMELFYQIFDKGTIEDAEGQTINFRNTLIIMTSNLASATLVAAVDNGECDPETLSQLIRPEFERVFSPALMGRMTLIPYLPLQPDALAQIIHLKLQHLCHRYLQAGDNLPLPEFNSQVVEWVAGRCHVRQSGARDIDQILNQHLLPLLAESVLQRPTASRLNINISEQSLVLESAEVMQ